MDHIGLELSLILLLVLANGVFSMAEMAVVSSRKARLRQHSEEGRSGAAVALELADNPHDFLSTVQVGITMIGTLAGAFGGATIAEKLAAYLEGFPETAAYADSLSITCRACQGVVSVAAERGASGFAKAGASGAFRTGTHAGA